MLLECVDLVADLQLVLIGPQTEDHQEIADVTIVDVHSVLVGNSAKDEPAHAVLHIHHDIHTYTNTCKHTTLTHVMLHVSARLRLSNVPIRTHLQPGALRQRTFHREIPSHGSTQRHKSTVQLQFQRPPPRRRVLGSVRVLCRQDGPVL